MQTLLQVPPDYATNPVSNQKGSVEVTDILVIGDAHVTVGYDNDRFDWLAKLVLDLKPDIVHSVGDWGDWTSLCSYEKGKGSHEGRRFMKDVAHCRDARDRVFGTLEKYNQGQADKHRTRYKPRFTMTLGNHCHRAWKAENDNVSLQGALVPHVLESYGPWEFFSFKQATNIEGISCKHFHPNKMGRATGGDNLAKLVLNKTRCSTLIGHDHRYDYAETADDHGRRMFCMSPGYFGHEDYEESWAEGTQQSWWHGVVLLRGVVDGWPARGYDRIPMLNLKQEYGK